MENMASSFLPALTLTAALIAALIKGSSGDPCKGHCGYGTLCKQYWGFFRGYYHACDCKEGFAILRQQGLVHFCHELCPLYPTQCAPNNKCYWNSRYNRYLCTCPYEARDARTGECPPKKTTSVHLTFTGWTDSTITSSMKDTTEKPNQVTSLTSVSNAPVPSLTSVSKPSMSSTSLTSVPGNTDPNIGDKSSLLTTGLAVGISGVVLLGLAVLAVILVKKRRQRTKGKGESAQRGSQTATATGDGSAYVNVIDIIPQQGGHGANNQSTLLPDLLSSSAQCQSGGTTGTENNKGGYEKVDLPPHPGITRATLSRYSLAGAFGDQQTSEVPKINELYSNHNIVKNKWNESTGEEISTQETALNDTVYHVLTRPNANPSSATARDIPDHYNTLSGVKAESTNESQVHIQSGETGTGNGARDQHADRVNDTT